MPSGTQGPVFVSEADARRLTGNIVEVAVEDNGEVVANPKLCTADSGLLVFKNGRGETFDIATAAGPLHGANAVLRCHLDQTTKAAMDAYPENITPRIFACPWMADVILLRSLGLPAVPAGGLEVRGHSVSQRLLHLVGGKATGDVKRTAMPVKDDEPDDPAVASMGEDQAEPFFRITLLNGSLYRQCRETPRLILRIVRSLLQVQHHLGFELEGIRLWNPTRSELATLEYRGSLRNAAIVQSWLHYYGDTVALDAFEFPKVPKSAEQSVADKFLKFVATSETGSQRPGPITDRQEYQALAHEFFVRPLIERALDTRNLDDRALTLHLATLARMYTEIWPTVVAWQRQWAGELQWNPCSAFPAEIYKPWNDLGKQIVDVISRRAALRKRKRRGQ